MIDRLRGAPNVPSGDVLVARPRGLLGGYELRDGWRQIGSIPNGGHGFELRGETYHVRREMRMVGDWILGRSPEEELARARQRLQVLRSFELLHEGRSLRLAARGSVGSGFVLWERDEEVGEIQHDALIGGDVTAILPEQLSLLMKVFLLSLALDAKHPLRALLVLAGI